MEITLQIPASVTYQREVAHCEPTRYARPVTVREVKDAQNASALDIVTFEEMGWQAVVAKGRKKGDRLFFIPVDSVLPLELSELLGVTKYLSKGRVKPATLRGNRSEGLVVDRDVVEPWLPYILKWDDLPEVSMKGDILSSKEVPFEFCTFYKMPNLMNEPDTFSAGERVYWSEKIHGTNARFARLIHPENGNPRLYIGSHATVHKNDCGSVYVRTIGELVEKLGGEEKLPLGVVFYGEIFGSKIQHLDYGRVVPEIRVFATLENGTYHTPEKTMEICRILGIETVDFRDMRFENPEQVKELADLPSGYTDRHHREGIVLRSAEDGGRMAKVIGETYLEGKGRTERH